jgi:acetoin utilization protein AcuC
MKTALVYHPEIKEYGFSKEHPLSGERFEIFFNFLKERTPDFEKKFEIIKPESAADDEILTLVHTKEYINAIKKICEGQFSGNIFQYLSSDNIDPLTGTLPKNIDKGARILVKSSVLAGELVASGKFKKAISFGGLHHAKPNYGEGFCIFNDVAICVENLKKKYNLKKILILDTDAHAGNGVKEIFYQDEKTLFLDIHQDPKTLYPGTGFLSEIGEGRGEGFTVNLCLPPGAGNLAYQYLFEKVIFPLAEKFQPEIIIRYGGSDPYYLDPLTDLALTLKGFLMIGKKVREIADKVCSGKVVDLLASGYNLKVLPYCWSALISGLLDLKIDLSDLKEKNPPPEDSKLKKVKKMILEVKNSLKKYWSSLR